MTLISLAGFRGAGASGGELCGPAICLSRRQEMPALGVWVGKCSNVCIMLSQSRLFEAVLNNRVVLEAQLGIFYTPSLGLISSVWFSNALT